MSTAFADLVQSSKKSPGDAALILGPMVRASSLPLRLAALDCGANLVFSEELPSWRAAYCYRYDNKCLGTIDYVYKSGAGSMGDENKKLKVLLRASNSREVKDNRLIVQLGAGDSRSALKAAR